MKIHHGDTENTKVAQRKLELGHQRLEAVAEHLERGLGIWPHSRALRIALGSSILPGLNSAYLKLFWVF
jgi:hypothetical protein